MNILYVNNSRIPTEKAHGLQIMKMCESFSKNGCGVELVLPKRKNLREYKNKDIFDIYDIERGVFKIKKIFSIDPRILLKFPNGIYIKFQILFFEISLFFYLLFKRNKKAYYFYTRDEYLLPLLLLFSKKVIWEGHSLPTRRLRYIPFWKRVLHIVCLTNCLRKKLIELGINKDKICVAPDAVDEMVINKKYDKLMLREQFGLNTDKKIVGYVGKLKTKGESKGAEYLIEAFKLLLQRGKNIFLLMVGVDEQERRDIELLLETKRIGRDKYKIVLHVSQKEIVKYLMIPDVLVMFYPKGEHYDCFMSPMKMFEYMASGVPFVSTEHESLKDILNETNSVLVEPENPQALSSGIKKILDDEDVSFSISQKALKDIKQYTWIKRAEKILHEIIK